MDGRLTATFPLPQGYRRSVATWKPRLGALAAGAAAVVAVATAVAPQSARAAPAEFHGVSVTTLLGASDYTRMREGGVRLARVQLYWGVVEPSPGIRDWTEFDALFESAATGGVRLLPTIYGSPPWVSTRAERPPLANAAQRAAWARFVGDLVDRYRPGGVFWTSRPALAQWAPTAWQVWNEPNLPLYWGGKPNASGYAKLLRLAAEAIRSSDDGAIVVMAGLLPYKTVRQSVPLDRYLEQLFRAPGARSSFDVAAIHPYAITPKGVLEKVQAMRELLNRNKARRAPIWVTEFGWSTGGREWARSPFRATEAQQARRLTASYRLMQKSSKRLRLQKALWFSYADSDYPGPDLWTARMGLFALFGTPKPAWFAYARSAGGQP